jgi:fibronectin-binding autotransporter adhesin
MSENNKNQQGQEGTTGNDRGMNVSRGTEDMDQGNLQTGKVGGDGLPDNLDEATDGSSGAGSGGATGGDIGGGGGATGNAGGTGSAGNAAE